MSWHDRDYNNSTGGAQLDFSSGPLSILNWSLPLGTWLGVRVSANFWLLLAVVLDMAYALRTGDWLASLIFVGLTLAALVSHEMGHRILAQWVGGRHDDFVLWPAGGMVQPTSPPQPWPFFLANVGGIGANALLCVLTGWVLHAQFGEPLLLPASFLAAFGAINPVIEPVGHHLLRSSLVMFYYVNLGLVVINLLPYYWFDGGPLLQAILWPFTSLYRAINVTCILGMLLAMPLFILSAATGNLMAMVLWAMLFFASYTKRLALMANGPQEVQDAIAMSATLRDLPAGKRRKLARRRFHWTKLSENRARQDEAKIDAILAKVSRSGLHSLSNSEKRILQRTTDRLKNRDRDLDR
ncbi:MAG: hypothetical protein HKL96_04820 [Phycisphaerales bacterium]|nr:hypothetical protein [Phycisphaerales bacterium]